MKKLALVLIMIASFTGVYAQNKTQDKKIKYFVEAAVKEFSLNEDQHKELLDARNAYITDYMTAAKSSEGEEKKTKLNEVNTKFNQILAKITGKTNGELQPFLARMREELPKV
ncbi:hypothetical protein [Mariniflexile sp. AS56]|uniref:hypothetical protein n=1 Tax=Mariniflexile sp. AS56 TaxID=3063957 RepID=UPI0026EFD43B|nr:hypothetical protein [Mariniflexile sp. AS56]MDO7173106.1 hypothetical protein [Mariniflexile sp. AS56]